MKNLFLISVFLFPVFVYAAADTCDPVVPSNDPAVNLPQSWVNVTTSGSYATSQSNDNIFWEIFVDYPVGIGCADQSLNNGSLTKRYCTLVVADDLTTLDVNENELRVVYGDIVSLSCPNGYIISAGQCVLLGNCPVVTPPPALCADGFSYEAGQELGYSGCDRPALKQCSNNTFVRDDIGICELVCSDFQTCFNYMVANSNCGASQNFVFNYIDPENFSFSCLAIDVASPDSPNNGGNSNGNPFDDPSTPATGPGSTPSVANIDPQSLATAIGAELEDDLSNIERAVRDDLDQSKINTGTIESAINESTTKNVQGFGDIEVAIRETAVSGESGSEAVRQSVDTLGSKLDVISSQLGSGGPCDPAQTDYYSCLQNPLSGLPAHSSGVALTFADANANFKSRLDVAPVVVAFSSINGIFDLQNAQCPPFEISLPFPIDTTVSSSIHCDLMNQISPVISAVMIIVYTVAGFRIFASA